MPPATPKRRFGRLQLPPAAFTSAISPATCHRTEFGLKVLPKRDLADLIETYLTNEGNTATPDHTDDGKSAEVVTGSDRAKFMAAATAEFIPHHQRSQT